MDKVIDGVNMQTNYTIQQFYTKEEYDKLQAENEQLHNDLKECGIKREQYRQALQEIKDIVDKAYYTEDYMLGQRFTELVDAINLTITNIGAEE